MTLPICPRIRTGVPDRSGLQLLFALAGSILGLTGSTWHTCRTLHGSASVRVPAFRRKVSIRHGRLYVFGRVCERIACRETSRTVSAAKNMISVVHINNINSRVNVPGTTRLYTANAGNASGSCGLVSLEIAGSRVRVAGFLIRPQISYTLDGETAQIVPLRTGSKLPLPRAPKPSITTQPPSRQLHGDCFFDA